MPENEKPEKTRETPGPEPEEREPNESTAPWTTVSETVGAEPPDMQEHLSGVIFGIVFSLAILAGVAYWFFAPHNRAQVFLPTSPQFAGQLGGMVLFREAPVSKGYIPDTLEVRYFDPDSKLKAQEILGMIKNHGAEDGRISYVIPTANDLRIS